MSIQILLEPQSINNKTLDLYSTTLNTVDLNVEAVNSQIVNYRTPDLGLLGDVLASDGTGNVYWTSNPAPPLSGILYNGVLPAITNRLLKVSNPTGTTADESSLSESLTEVELTTNKPFKTVKTVFTDNQEFVTKLYVDSLPVVDLTTLNDASGVINSIISSNVSPNFLLKGLISSTAISLAPIGNDIQITNTAPSTLITVNNVGTNSLISSNSNPTFNLKGLIASTGILLSPVGNDIEITNNLPSSLININSVGSGNSILSTNINPTFTTKSIIAGTNISIASTTTDLTINATASAPILEGFPFNPVINATQTSGTTGTKNYYYQVLITNALTINGFRVYLSAGSDPIRVGIYRNFVDASPISNATLVGQSNLVVPTIGLPYTNGIILPQPLQNLTFAQNEYMVIGFHSAGITNTYLSSATGFGNVDIAFNGPNPAAGYLATLTSVNQSSVLTNRICFTLH